MLITRIAGLTASEEGQSMVEYAIMVVVVAIVVMAAAVFLGSSISSVFSSLASAL